METVIGLRAEGSPARLRDYHRYAVRDEDYPGIVAQKGLVVEGIVYKNLPDRVWRLLDTFEGEMYRRTVVPVETEDGTLISAQTYVVRAEFMHRLSERTWSPEKFLRSGKARFETEYIGFHALKGEK